MNDDLKNEVVYEIDTCHPRESYLKPIYLKKPRKYVMLSRVFAGILTAETIVLCTIDRSSARPWWVMLLFSALIYFLWLPFLRRNNKIKDYEKIHATNEDRHSYVFYKDHVKVTTPTTELTLAYDTAEHFVENDDRLIIAFPLNRNVGIEKKQCDEEILAFFRNIVPKEKQKKSEGKSAKKFFMIFALNFFCAAFLAVSLVKTVGLNAEYHSKYPESTYGSFESCLDYGVVKEVVIIKNKYVEYTYIGRGEDERYYTVYPDDDIYWLTNKLNAYDVNWKFE